MKIHQKRLLLYFAGLVAVIAVAVVLKQVWHEGGSVFFFYLGALLFGLLLTLIGGAITFFPLRLMALFGRQEPTPISPLRRMELLSIGLLPMLVGLMTLGLMIISAITGSWGQ